MSGETNFSGVHKNSLAARGFGARPLASPSPTDAQKFSCKQDPARQLTRFSREKIKILVKIKKFSSPTQQGAVTSLQMAGDRSPCLSVYGLISVKMVNGSDGSPC